MATIAKLQVGELEGRDRGGHLLFAGIPYARPPIGVRRFAAPEAHPGWSGVRNARRFGPAAPQLPGTGLTRVPVEWDEDCLTLNVSTPGLDGAGRPVFVWIHGGAFVHGKGGIPWYDGGSFAERGDVVTVSINYRLGALGFANLPLDAPELAATGRLGLLDQIEALRWVRDHIAEFGGDPDRVTVAGESAGAMSIGNLLAMPDARGLFRAAILQSGAAHHHLPEPLAHEVGAAFLQALGVDSVEGIQAASVETILEAQQAAQEQLVKHPQAASASLGSLAYQPSLGGALPGPPLDAIAEGAIRDLPILIGTNTDETTLWGYHDYDARRLERLSANIFPDADQALATYRRSRPDADPGELATAISTDQLFRIPALRVCEAQHAAGGRAFLYRFSWKSRAFGGRLGATHALEIPFAFHNLERPGISVFLGPGELPVALADRMHACWTAFVHTGDPNCDALAATWPAFDPERYPTQDFGEQNTVLEDPGSAERQLWKGLR